MILEHFISLNLRIFVIPFSKELWLYMEEIFFLFYEKLMKSSYKLPSTAISTCSFSESDISFERFKIFFKDIYNLS